ncbi:hypothetical protein EI546_07030 [Aequorivita sp. H23M31]|uniref:WD40 repeat domain-containing protein n=1 Tax=Aequorivita ciconiae TaxID=2494375 RepID=A0A410G2I0_9FLAO|nr:hypothetical protein [Aequorivita sp. H23M31]QAA81494.1 hypothetical protein EI546_07030 [Aequorivita sp. H23M31]
MNKLVFTFFILCCGFIFSQDNTEVYVFDIAPSYGGLDVMNAQNISNNKGYNNQPSFISNEVVVFAKNNEGQTDIAEYNLTTKTEKWICNDTEGSEYSPQKFPTSNDVAAVRLDTDGKQRLYRYNSETGVSNEIIENLQVAYFAFYNNEKMLATVLSGDIMDLVLVNLKTKSTDTLLENAGRSLQKIPGNNSMSYTLVNEDKNLDLYVLDMNLKESFFICELPSGTQDYVWLNDTQILTGKGSKLYIYDTLGTSEWNRVASLEEYEINDITRMAISPDGKKLALVAAEN